MIQLKERDFENLIIDFYTVFAPHQINNVPNIVEKYKGTALNQLNAIKAAYIKYYRDSKNIHGHSNILDIGATDQNMTKLLEAYSNGERIISPDEIKKQAIIEQVKQQEEKTQVEKIIKKENEIIESLKKTIDELSNNSSIEMDYEIGSFIEFDSIDDKGKITYKSVDIEKINFVPKKYINSLCIGQRIMVSDKEGRVVGIEVVSIHDDYISNEKGPIRILDLKKV
jgi:hypothetical protein